MKARATEWRKDGWQPENFTITATPGPKGAAAALQSEEPVDFVELFLTPELIQSIVEQTNLYAQQTISFVTQHTPHSHIKSWKPVTVHEMKVFLGLHFLTGIIRKPCLKMYWSTDELLSTPIFGKHVSRKRFELIMRFMHFSDNSNPNTRDKLYKVCPILDLVLSKFRELYQPAQNIAIDEGMLLWRGHLAF